MSELDQASLITFIRETLVAHLDASVDATTPLLSSGLIDSYSLVELVLYIEQQTGVRVAPSQQSRAHFETVERIVALVDELRRSDER